MKVIKSCAHVTCKTCTESLVRPAKQCVVCDAKLGENDLIQLSREGALELFPPCLRAFNTSRRYRFCVWGHGRDLEKGSRFPGVKSVKCEAREASVKICFRCDIHGARLLIRYKYDGWLS